MIGKITNRGVVSGCRFEQGELFYLVNKVNGKTGMWMRAKHVMVMDELQKKLKQTPLQQLLADPIF